MYIVIVVFCYFTKNQVLSYFHDTYKSWGKSKMALCAID